MRHGFDRDATARSARELNHRIQLREKLRDNRNLRRNLRTDVAA